MYFDADEGLLVYLKNVRVNDPRFTLSGANELKIFLEKKPAQNPESPKRDGAERRRNPPTKRNQVGGGIGAKFGDVERVFATGAVRILQKAANGQTTRSKPAARFSPTSSRPARSSSGAATHGSNRAPPTCAPKNPTSAPHLPNTGSFVTEGNGTWAAPLDRKAD